MTTTVWVRKSSAGSGMDIYHTNETCRYVSTNFREFDEETAQAWGMNECEYCADAARKGPGTHTHYNACLEYDG